MRRLGLELTGLTVRSELGGLVGMNLHAAFVHVSPCAQGFLAFWLQQAGSGLWCQPPCSRQSGEVQAPLGAFLSELSTEPSSHVTYRKDPHPVRFPEEWEKKPGAAFPREAPPRPWGGSGCGLPCWQGSSKGPPSTIACWDVVVAST